MTIELDSDDARRMEALRLSGEFRTASDVIAAALRTLEDRQAAVRRLGHAIETGLAQLGRGEGIDGEAFMNRLFVEGQDRESPAGDE